MGFQPFSSLTVNLLPEMEEEKERKRRRERERRGRSHRKKKIFRNPGSIRFWSD